MSSSHFKSVVFIVCLSTSVLAVDFHVSLDAFQEIPTPTLGGATPSGTATVSVDTISGNVSVSGMFSGLTSDAQMAHLHGLAPAGSTAGVIFGLNSVDNSTAGMISGNGSLSSPDLLGLLEGNTYLNLHTSNNGPGEIRGQVLDSDIHVFSVGLDAIQEIPTPNIGNAMPVGSALVVVDSSTGEVEISGSYSGLTSNIVGSHLHGLAGPGSTAPVIFGLTNTGGTSGTFNGTGTLSSLEIDGMLSGNTYLNLHTEMNGPGEIRGQVVPEPGSLTILWGLLTISFAVFRRQQ